MVRETIGGSAVPREEARHC